MTAYPKPALPRRLFLSAGVMVLALVCVQGATAGDYSAAYSGSWSNPAIWSPWGAPDFGDRTFIGSSYYGGSAHAATVALDAARTVDSVYVGYGAGCNGTLNLAGQQLYVDSTIALGASGGSGSILHNGGSFTTSTLSLDSRSFLVLGGSDMVTSNLSVSGSSQVTTVWSGNIANNASLDLSSTLTLGAPLVLAGQLDLEGSSTLNMAGNRLTASSVYFGAFNGQAVNVLNRGPITATSLSFSNGAFDLSASDAVTSFTLSNAASTLHSAIAALSLGSSAQAATTPTGNVNGNVGLDQDSTLTLGAPMTLSGQFDAERNSTLDMNGQPLRANNVYLGWYNPQPANLLQRGPILAANLYVGNCAFDLSASDAVTSFSLSNATSTLHSGVSALGLSNTSQAATTPAGNVNGNVALDLSSTLSLGAPLIVSGQVDVERNSTLNMAGNPLIASSVYLANYGQAVTVLNRGPIYATNLYIGYGTWDLSASDAVGNFTLTSAASTLHSSVYGLSLSYSAQAATTPAGNVTGNVTLDRSSTLTLAAPMTLTGQLDVERNSTLDMNGQSVRANSVLLGWDNWYYGGGLQPVNLLNRGPITANSLQVAAGTFDLSASDTVTNFSLVNAVSTLSSFVNALSLSNTSQATTTPAGNVTGNATLDLSSTLTLGAPMTLTGQLDLERGSTLNMAGNRLIANAVYLASYGEPVAILNRGPITATTLNVGAGTFDLSASDAVANFSLDNSAGTLHSFVSGLNLANSAQAATTPTGSAFGNVSLDLSSTLSLGTPLTLNGQMVLERDATLNMNGQPLRANTVYFGWSYQQPVNVINRGPIAAANLYVGSSGTLRAANSAINILLDISYDSVLTLEQPSGQLTGMTFHGSSSSALAINDTSVLQLSSGSNSGPSWIFRWQDPAAGTWESALGGLIAAGRLAVTPSAGYSIFDQGGYTYIAAPTTLTWNGGGGDNNWSTADNWGGATPQAGHWLRFGALSASPSGHVANTNDLSGSPLFYGIFFDAAAPAYNLQGNPIQLSGSVLNQSGADQTIGLDIQLVHGNGAFPEGTFDTGGMTITDSGSIGGAGMKLVKAGSGTLVLSGTNTYSGGTVVDGGTLVVTSASALLDGSDLFIGGAAVSIFAAAAAADQATAAAAPTPVPEPAALALLAAALGVAIVCRRGRGR
jgi:fibronectin-binding autotransporter adhesin